nr:class I adenylate cyclase [Desulfobacteraceae bacterium]
TVDGESSGSAQRTLLKDEFYRTFIMIAGKIPLWAVLPSNIDTKKLIYLNSPDALNGDYIDTGYLSGIDRRECLGAVLWQIYKARKDPVKALIKSSLCGYYAFNPEPNNLVSAMVKAGFSKTLIDDYLFDPYVIVFDKIMAFYEAMADSKGLDLIRQCIYLRLLSYPLMIQPDEDSPKGRLLSHFVSQWKPDRKRLIRLREFDSLEEHEKIAFEDIIFDKLSFIYELILRSSDEDNSTLFMKKNDLTILKNRTAAFLQKKLTKLPRCSSSLRRKTNMVIEISEFMGQNTWSVIDISDWALKTLKTPLFTGPEYLKSIGWVFANHLHTSRITPESALLTEIVTFFAHIFPRPDSVFTKAPYFEKILILLTAHEPGGSPTHADYLLFNSWGEFFFNTLDLSGIESIEGKWYKIKELIDKYQSKRIDLKLQHLVCQAETIQPNIIPEALKHSTCVNVKKIPEKKYDPDSTGESKKKSQQKLKPFLDKL